MYPGVPICPNLTQSVTDLLTDMPRCRDAIASKNVFQIYVATKLMASKLSLEGDHSSFVHMVSNIIFGSVCLQQFFLFVTHVCHIFYVSNKNRIISKIVTNINLNTGHLSSRAKAHAI